MKIIVVNIKYFGDLIIITPALKALRLSYPDAEISVLVREEYKEVLKYNPYINSILTFNPEIKGSKKLKALIEGIKLILRIRKEKFDIFVAMHPGDRIAILAWFSKAKIRIAPGKQTLSFLFNKHVDVYEDTISYMEYYNKIISALNIIVESDQTEFYITEKEIKWAENFFIDNKLIDKKIICIHPGASEPSKIWKKENFIKLLKQLQSKDLMILIICGPQDNEIVSQIKKEINDEKVTFYYSDSILKTAALIKKSLLLITHDTGTRHLAVALKIPVVALLPDDNIKCWNFYTENDKHYYLVGKRFKDGKESYLGNISPDEVYNKVFKEINLC